MEEPWTGNIYSLSLELQGPKILRWNWAGQEIFRFKIKWRNINSYDMNLPTGIFCRTLNGKNFYSFNLHMFMGEKSLERYNRVQSHHFWHSMSPFIVFIRECWRGVSYTLPLLHSLMPMTYFEWEHTGWEKECKYCISFVSVMLFCVSLGIYRTEKKKDT